MTSSLIAKADLDGSARGRPALAIRGTIGAAAAGWLRERLDEAHLTRGRHRLAVLPRRRFESGHHHGRDHPLARARDRGRHADASGQITRSYCASACVLVYAGGKPRYGVDGSVLGVHRFVTSSPGRDPVADTQRTTGTVLSYMTRMGISSSVVEAMSETRDVRWLGPKEASAMHLITDPFWKPCSRPPLI